MLTCSERDRWMAIRQFCSGYRSISLDIHFGFIAVCSYRRYVFIHGENGTQVERQDRALR